MLLINRSSLCFYSQLDLNLHAMVILLEWIYKRCRHDHVFNDRSRITR